MNRLKYFQKLFLASLTVHSLSLVGDQGEQLNLQSYQHSYISQNGWKQWLLPTGAAQFVYGRHNSSAEAGISGKSSNMPGYVLPLFRQYTNYAATVGSNHCFQAVRIYRD